MSEVGKVQSFYGEGQSSQHDPETEQLSSIIEVLNERFGTDLTDVDKLLLAQFEESLVADGELADQAQHNFRLVFDKNYLLAIATRVDANEGKSSSALRRGLPGRAGRVLPAEGLRAAAGQPR